MDIIVTIPLHRLEISQQEDEAVKGLSDEKCNWYWLLKPKPKNLFVGDRIYFVENGLITAWCPVMELGYFDFKCEVSGKQWTGYQARLGQNRVYVNPIAYRGFQGWRYVSPELSVQLNTCKVESLHKLRTVSKNKLRSQVARIKKLRVTQVPATSQVDYVQNYILGNKGSGERVIISSTEKRNSEDLSEYLKEFGLEIRYFHSDIKSYYRRKIAKEFIDGRVDALVVVDTLAGLPRPSTVVVLCADEDHDMRDSNWLARLGSFSKKNIIVCANKVTPAIRDVFKGLS